MDGRACFEAKESVWLNTDDDNEEALKKVEKKAEKVENSQSVQKAQEKHAEEKASDNEVIIPFSKEKNHINGTKKRYLWQFQQTEL